MKNETEYSKTLKKQFEQAGAVCLKIVGNFRQESGWPDLYVASPLLHKSCVWLEAKWEFRDTSPLQRKRIKELLRREVPAFFIRYFPDESPSRRERIELADSSVVGFISGDGLDKLRQIRVLSQMVLERFDRSE